MNISLKELNVTRPNLRSLVKAQLGLAVLSLEVLKTQAEHEKGFMFRDPPESNFGLLFIYPQPRALGFWMKNVSFDLDLIALNSQGLVAQIERLKAFDTKTVTIRFPCDRVIEVPAGFCAQNNVRLGSQLIMSTSFLQMEG